MSETRSAHPPRRPHDAPAVQLGLFKQRGGKRRGAGRPPKGPRSGSSHKVRPALASRYPVHVVLRVVSAVGNLRRRCVYRAVREATLTAARLGKIRIVHLSIQRTHLHLLVEAHDKRALASGMQGFQISAARHINAAISKDRPGPRRRARYSRIAITQRSSRRPGRHGTLCATSSRTGESTEKIAARSRAPGTSTGSRARRRSRTGLNMAMNHGCGRGRRPTSRSGCTGPRPGSCGRAGSAAARRSRATTYPRRTATQRIRGSRFWAIDRGLPRAPPWARVARLLATNLCDFV